MQHYYKTFFYKLITLIIIIIGYELTMRVNKSFSQKKAPKWPIKLMQALARYTFNNGRFHMLQIKEKSIII